jgi:hemoglobin/transferrin/lactoferrin receptor protein
VFQNKIDDFIDPTFDFSGGFPGVFQYRNISKATIEGVELEGMYDAKAWFLGVAAHRIRGTNEETGEGLYSIPADRVTLTAGFRTLEERLVVGGRLHLVAAQDRVPSSFFGAGGGSTGAVPTADGYTLVDLFGQYIFNDSAVLNVNIDNLFDRNYRPYLYQLNNPGFTARIGMTMRFGAGP